MSFLRTTDQIKIEFAFNCARNASVLGKEYKSYVKKLPMLIKTNGLGAAFAFMYSKRSKEEGKFWNSIGRDIYNWLNYRNMINSDKVRSFDELVFAISQISSVEYRKITSEVLSFLSWLKRFADGLIEGD
ncbi:MAG: type III-B CRISPR module-associated protein Cmr5 [Ignavibacteria bacterium]|nr:type III-B CRISPR module-associated protein Cmr5 [Ignavibacteria bacterium]